MLELKSMMICLGLNRHSSQDMVEQIQPIENYDFNYLCISYVGKGRTWPDSNRTAG